MVRKYRRALTTSLVILGVALVSVLGFEARAGGASGTGSGLGIVQSTDQEYTFSDYLAERRAKAIEYAFGNEVFQEELKSAITVYGAALGGVPPEFSSTLLTIKEQFELDQRSLETGKNFSYWYETILNIIEVVLPDIGWLSAAKVAVAFATGYIYGLFFGV